MKKKIIVSLATAILTIGTMTAVYAKESKNANNIGFSGTMMRQNYINNNSNYNRMIDLMKQAGFQAAAEAMENRDVNSMNNFMNNLTDDQYNKMIEIMNNNGFNGMGKMMGTVSRQQMITMHNSMMGR